jgi:hypothetical protein
VQASVYSTTPLGLLASTQKIAAKLARITLDKSCAKGENVHIQNL